MEYIYGANNQQTWVARELCVEFHRPTSFARITELYTQIMAKFVSIRLRICPAVHILQENGHPLEPSKKISER